MLFTNISHTNRKQNQLSKWGFAQTVVLKIRKSGSFQELYENEPEMAAPRLETNIRYLWPHVWWACFHDQKRFKDSEAYKKSWSLFQGFSEVYWLANM